MLLRLVKRGFIVTTSLKVQTLMKPKISQFYNIGKFTPVALVAGFDHHFCSHRLTVAKQEVIEVSKFPSTLLLVKGFSKVY